jgi:tRNA-Thr(GGU) m(6)t(6)A37 methyltransferase TsaA
MIAIAAQVSLYPLHQEHLAPAIEAALRIFREHGLDVEPGAMSSVITGNDEALFAALQEAFRFTAQQGHVVMTVTFSNACSVPSPEKEQEVVSYKPIGHVQHALDDRGAPAAESTIVLDPALTEGLTGLVPGQQVTVIFHFHQAQGYDLLQHPRGDTSRPKRGVFSLRSSRRPTRIGVTVVELLAIEENVLRVRGLDAFDGTPVLDLKPA